MMRPLPRPQAREAAEQQRLAGAGRAENVQALAGAQVDAGSFRDVQPVE